LHGRGAPGLRHPSVVCGAPDGRVLVAEDPMNISAPSDRPLGRILCRHPTESVILELSEAVRAPADHFRLVVKALP
jgi:hypothetical protein